MDLINFSNMTVSQFTNSGNTLIMQDVFTQICTQLNNTIVKAVMLIIIVYVSRTIIISRSLKYWENPDKIIKDRIPTDLIYQGVKHLDSLLETLGLGASLYILAIAYYEGMLGFWSYLILWILGFFVLLVAIATITNKIRNKKKNGA